MSDNVVTLEKRRRYTRRDKAALVGQAEVSGVRHTAREAGIPVSTLEYWRQHGDFAQLRTEKREEVAQDIWATFQMGVRRVAQLIPETDDVQKVATTAAILFDKLALMRGEATSRTESRDLTDTLDDHEREQLRVVLDSVLSQVPSADGD